MTIAQDGVIVVGAGPTGLLLASELALAGITVTVLEKRREPDPTIKAGSVNVATAEILDRRGLGSAARAAHQDYAQSMTEFRAAVEAGQSWQQQAARHTASSSAEPTFPVTGHFAGMLFRPALVDQSDPVLAAHRGIDGATLVQQIAVERILGAHAESVGVTIRRETEVTNVVALTDERTGDACGVRVESSAGVFTAGWLVGTDGGRSLVRKTAGIAFPGTEPETTGYQAIANLEGTAGLQPGWVWTPTGVYSYGPIPGRILTVQFTGAPADRAAPVTKEELQASIRLVNGHDVTVVAIHGSPTRWTDNARQAATYRAGRILLAGDAAHVHSPFSGQGLNLGAGDAINLGWKLAATIKGTAPDGLLDTYDSERRPIGTWVLDWTRAQVALMRGDTKVARLREVIADDLLSTPSAMTRMVKLASGIAQTYPTGRDHGVAGVTVDGDDALLGRLIGDTSFVDGSRLADRFHRGHFVLLDHTSARQFETEAAGWSDRVTVVHEAEIETGSYRDLSGLLVRPDGVIVWMARGASEEPTTDTLTESLTRWAGPKTDREDQA
jgi:2-polyprenyl-6-methoxyphenol hydroxylase-like FAD-dependent oxidoreductase